MFGPSNLAIQTKPEHNNKNHTRTDQTIPAWKRSETSLMRSLHEQTLPDATQPIGKMFPFSKIFVTFELIQQLLCPLRCRISKKW